VSESPLASSATLPSAARGARRASRVRPPLAGVLSSAYLSVIVVLPIAALISASAKSGFWSAVSAPQSVSALKFTVVASLIVAAINMIAGLALAWVLVRDDFPGKGVVNAIVDLPFALPTIVAGLTLLALYGSDSPVHINVAHTRISVVLALLFVTLPFVVRAVQPVLNEIDRDMEQAAESLGAKPMTVFRRIVLPNLLPAILSGGGLAFARAIGEFGSVVLISGNRPFHTEVASVLIAGRVENGDSSGAAAVSVVLLVASFVLLLAMRALAVRGSRRRG
jgi:sulfate transport system permease protein